MEPEQKSGAGKEKRVRVRQKPLKPNELNLTFRSEGLQTRVIAARVADLHEEGCGVETGLELPVGARLAIAGELFGRQRQLQGKVAWCVANPLGGYRAGIEFAEAIQPFRAGAAGTSLGAVLEGEQTRRRAILTSLYRRRAVSPSQPAVGVDEMELALGTPRSLLEFTLWYLDQRGFIEGSDDGRYWITVAGVDSVEASATANRQ
jgi:hypothetical protein